MELDESLFEEVHDGDVRGHYRKPVSKQKQYDKVLDKIQVKIIPAGYRIGTDGEYLFINLKIVQEKNADGELVSKKVFMNNEEDYKELVDYLDSIGIKHEFKKDNNGLRLMLLITLDNAMDIDIDSAKSLKQFRKENATLTEDTFQALDAKTGEDKFFDIQDDGTLTIYKEDGEVESKEKVENPEYVKQALKDMPGMKQINIDVEEPIETEPFDEELKEDDNQLDFKEFLDKAEVIFVDDAETFDINEWEEENRKDSM